MKKKLKVQISKNIKILYTQYQEGEYTEEEYNSQKHCFQIVCLGKLGVPYEFYKKIYDKRHAKNKKDNSDVQPNRDNDEEVCCR